MSWLLVQYETGLCLVACMHQFFWMSDEWVPASWVNQVILHHEGRRNPEDEVVRNEGGQMNEMIQTKGTSRTTKHAV